MLLLILATAGIGVLHSIHASVSCAPGRINTIWLVVAACSFAQLATRGGRLRSCGVTDGGLIRPGKWPVSDGKTDRSESKELGLYHSARRHAWWSSTSDLSSTWARSRCGNGAVHPALQGAYSMPGHCPSSYEDLRPAGHDLEVWSPVGLPGRGGRGRGVQQTKRLLCCFSVGRFPTLDRSADEQCCASLPRPGLEPTTQRTFFGLRRGWTRSRCPCTGAHVGGAGGGLRGCPRLMLLWEAWTSPSTFRPRPRRDFPPPPTTHCSMSKQEEEFYYSSPGLVFAALLSNATP
jgi:hypothetical protein